MQPRNAPSQNSDSELDVARMVRFQRGDREAYSQLVRIHHVRVYQYVLRYVRNRAIAEDIVQEVFMRVFSHAAQYQPERSFGAWLFSIARNGCIDHLRKASHREGKRQESDPSDASATVLDGVPDRGESGSVERAAVSREVRVRIERALQQLPEDQREAFLLRQVANLSFREVAEVTQSSENTAKSRVRYALEFLRADLADYEEHLRAVGG